MVWIDDLVADLVDGRLSVELEVLDFELLLNNCVANGVPSYASRRCRAPFSLSGLQITVHEVDLL
jgi:hypothetical protein